MRNHRSLGFLGFQEQDLDGIVYQQALQSFRQNLLKYNVSVESCQSCFAEAGT